MIVAPDKSAVMISEPASQDSVDNVEIVVQRFETIGPESQATCRSEHHIGRVVFEDDGKSIRVCLGKVVPEVLLGGSFDLHRGGDTSRSVLKRAWLAISSRVLESICIEL